MILLIVARKTERKILPKSSRNMDTGSLLIVMGKKNPTNPKVSDTKHSPYPCRMKSLHEGLAAKKLESSK